MQLKQKLLSTTINGLAYFLPAVSARISYRLWTSTHRHKMPDKEQTAFNQAQKQKLTVDGMQIMTYSWFFDEKRPIVLLLHGWNGRGTQLCAFLPALEAAGYSVLAFDAYGHGLSEGDHTNILQTSAIIKKLALTYGDFFAMIGHSFGAMAAVNAINSGVNCKKLVAISPPTEFSALLLTFSNFLGLNTKATSLLENYVLKKYAIESFESISITGIAPHMNIPSLFVHDENDDRVPLSQSQKAAQLWPGGKLHITKGLGHVRILRKLAVVSTVVRFLDGECST